MINKIKKPKLSIVTIVYNAEQYIEQTIKSIINQTYKNIEYIIIDGASTDKTLDIIKKYEDSISIYISEKDNGIYDAMNKGINLATGDFIWFMNAGDEIYDKYTVENMFEDFDNEDAFYGKTQLILENGDYASITKTPDKLTWKNFMHGMVVSHQSIILSTKSISKYNIQYKVVSDHDWIISALKNCKKIKNTDQIVSKYLLGGFSNQNFIKGWKERLIIINEHYGRLIYIFNLLLFGKAIIKNFIKKNILGRK